MDKTLKLALGMFLWLFGLGLVIFGLGLVVASLIVNPLSLTLACGLVFTFLGCYAVSFASERLM